ncbi:ABC transporter substrate-binding protein [Nocardia sp. alder85J]|uniref:ABC transporter substrate-binding protein n=1 Tax=Nocardia sp. alder85J TaxID=2862949 RepID=UPI001CD4ADB7|nr:ABC transporter substrate-binding protein [Nocardia sp. alder85J]MCX4095601.1 ABC transporter substrate-binding protein [Nocardia sp. alder85J]
MRHNGVFAALAAVMAAALLAACGSSNSDDSSNASTATGTPISFYVLGPSADNNQNDSSQGKLGVTAAVTAINKAGGVKNHPLKPVFCAKGIQSDANVIAACGRDAVADQSVSAFVWGTNNYGSAIDPILEQAGLACLGCQPFTQADFGSPMLFPFEPGALSVVGLAALGADQLKAAKIDMAIPDVPAGHGLPTLIDSLGLKPRNTSLGQVVYVPATAVDVTAAAGQVNGADLVINTLLQGQQAPFLQALRQQGNKVPMMISGSTNSAPGLGQQYGDQAEGIYAGSVYNRNSEGYKRYKADLGAIGAGDSELNTDQSIGAWLSVQLFADIANQLDGNPTRQAVLDKVKTLTAYDTKGLTPSIDFSKPGTLGGGHFPSIRNDAMYLLQYKNGELQPVGTASRVFGGQG